MQIAIDGPAGSGKSTIAKLLAEELGYLYLDTGAMYRAISYAALKENYDLKKQLGEIHKLVDKYKISFDGKKVFLNDEDVTDIIRSPEVTGIVSQISEDKLVRDKLIDIQRAIAGDNDIILDGRDIGTVVLPNAEFKFYMDATPLLRAKRRAKDMNIDVEDSEAIEELKEQIIRRDKIDSSREFGALKRADDAYYIVTDDLNIQEVLDKLLGIIKEG